MKTRTKVGLVVFAGIPLLIIFANVEAYGLQRPWLKTASVALVASTVALLAFGELMSSRMSA